MNRFRNIVLVVSWAGFLWGVYYIAVDKPVSDIFWINLAYVAATITIAIVLLFFSYWGIASALRPRPAGAIAIGIGLILAIAAIEVFFLRDAIAGWLSM